MAITVAATLFTAIVLTALFWAYRRKQEEKRLRKQGIVTIPIDAGYMVTAGCLGVLGYMGLLFVLLSLTLDLVEQAVGPDWLAWVVAIGLLVGFFSTVGWAVFGIGSSFAITRLVVDKRGIRLIRWRSTKSVILWDRQWHLERMAHIRRVRYRAFESGTEYTLLMRLRQGRNELLLYFDVPGDVVGGLPPYEGSLEGHHVLDEVEWLQSELLFRHKQWDEGPEKKPAGAKPNADELRVAAPDAALMNALDFTEEDLALNRDGLPKSSQTTPLRRDKKLTLFTYLVLAAAFGAGALYNLNRLLQGRSFDAVGPLLIVCLLVTSFCLIMAISTQWDIRSEINVERVSGQIHLQHYRQSGEYWLRIGEEAFHITKQLFDVLEDGDYYHLYVARHGFGGHDTKLLSAEKLKPAVPN